MMEGPRHQHLHQEWQEPLEELGVASWDRLVDESAIESVL